MTCCWYWFVVTGPDLPSEKSKDFFCFVLCAVCIVASLKFAKKWGDQLNLHQQVPCQYSKEHMSQFACKNLWYWYFQIFELLENQGLEPELHTHHQLTCAVVEGDFLILNTLSRPLQNVVKTYSKDPWNPACFKIWGILSPNERMPTSANFMVFPSRFTDLAKPFLSAIKNGRLLPKTAGT